MSVTVEQALEIVSLVEKRESLLQNVGAGTKLVESTIEMLKHAIKTRERYDRLTAINHDELAKIDARLAALGIIDLPSPAPALESRA